jgi:CubicO group peptidase (beta-lactamase class C family)
MFNLHFAFRAILLLLFVALAEHAVAQQLEPLYFPDDARWETVPAAAVGIDQEGLEKAIDFAMERKSSSIIVLHRGRILAERHTDVKNPTFRYRSMLHGKTKSGQVIEDVASVQKSVTSILVGLAMEKQLLQLTDAVSKHLGVGWSNASAKQESAITVRHLVTMTSGLNDSLHFAAPAGSTWKYNSTAYGKSLDVVSAAAKMSPNALTELWLTGPLGMQDSKWITRRSLLKKTDATNSHGLTTSARDLARFGLMMLANGHWHQQSIVNNQDYLKQATSSSQLLNPAYGYLWWLNGHSFALRGPRKVAGPLIPDAPTDLYAALGALGRKCYVVPSRQLVVVRLGDDPETAGAPKFDEELWRLLKETAKSDSELRR